MNKYPDDRLWDSFFKGHPLRLFCANSPISNLLQSAELLAANILQCVADAKTIPYAPDSLEEYLNQQGIQIAELMVNSPIKERAPFFLSACEPEDRLIKLYPDAIARKAAHASITVHQIRALLLAHEWFHIIIFELGTPPELKQFAKSERIIIEEAAARIFAVRLLGFAFHPAILDGALYLASIINADNGQTER